MQKEIAGAAQSSGRMRRAARLRPPMDKEDERASLRRDADDVVAKQRSISPRDRQATHSDARGWLRDALVGGAVPGPTWHGWRAFWK